MVPSKAKDPGVSPGCYLAISKIALFPFPMVMNGQDNLLIVLHNSFTTEN